MMQQCGGRGLASASGGGVGPAGSGVGASCVQRRLSGQGRGGWRGVVAVNIGGLGCGPAAVGVECMVIKILMKKVTVSVFVRKEHLLPLAVLAAEISLCVGAGESR